MSRGLGDVYKRQTLMNQNIKRNTSSLLRKMINFGLKKVKELLGSRNTQKLKM